MAAGRAHRSNAGAKMAGLLDKEVGCLKVLIYRFKILVKTSFCGEWNLEFGSNTTEKFEISRGEAE